MATRVAPTPIDADNPAGSFTLAACSDWRSVRRFHVGTEYAQGVDEAGKRIERLETAIGDELGRWRWRAGGGRQETRRARGWRILVDTLLIRSSDRHLRA